MGDPQVTGMGYPLPQSGAAYRHGAAVTPRSSVDDGKPAPVGPNGRVRKLGHADTCGELNFTFTSLPGEEYHDVHEAYWEVSDHIAYV
jgi:hypothetical protein